MEQIIVEKWQLTKGTEDPGCVGAFNTTHWSVVLAAGQAESSQSTAALEKLCRTYWYPLYMYVRRQGNSPEDAQDLTQDFFSRLLAKNYLAKADRERGKFRTFLLGSLKNFTINEWKRAGRVTASTSDLVSPDRNTSAPSAANSLATAAPTNPPRAEYDATLIL
jgi:DNA-directed RNA polymerase specialized sigma24 family protein